MRKPVVVLAMPRSGTNLLRRSLATSKLFKDFNEVLQPSAFDNSDEPGPFWVFRQKLFIKEPELSFPSKENQEKIFCLFIEDLLRSDQSQSNDVIPLIDIKYTSIHNFSAVWQSPMWIPHLLNILSNQSVPIIHLIRENILETYVSSILANKTGIWVAYKNQEVQSSKIDIHVDSMLKHLRMYRDEIQLFRQWLKESSVQHIEIKYEDLIDTQGFFSKEVKEGIMKFLKLREFEIFVPTKKIAKSLQDNIRNYREEIKPALLKSEFKYLLTE